MFGKTLILSYLEVVAVDKLVVVGVETLDDVDTDDDVETELDVEMLKWEETIKNHLYRVQLLYQVKQGDRCWLTH